MTYNESLKKLKTRMEGKTVLRVEPPEAAEAICKFYMSDGSVFRLHATDLGFWVEDTKDPKDIYTSLDMMFRDYEHHAYQLGEMTPKTTCVKHSDKDPFRIGISVTASDGRVFEAWVRIDSEEGELFSKEGADNRLTYAAEIGDMWRMAFRT